MGPRELNRRRLATAAVSILPASLVAWLGTGFMAGMLRGPVNRLVGHGPADVTVRTGPAQGLHLFADLGSEKHYWVGQREPHVLAAIERLVPRGGTVWDIGAHIGFTAFLAARVAGPDGHVYAFEPVPENRERLIEGKRLNGFTNVTAREEALSHHPGEALLAAGPTSLQWSLRGSDRAVHGRLRVTTTTLDMLAEELGAPDLIKVDVEESEVDVLRGGTAMLSRHRPAVIVEFTPPQRVEEARTLLPDHRFELLGDNHWLIS